MFDIGWGELLLVAVVALVVIGPKDLPRALRTLGQWAAKARSAAREFQSNIDEMMRDSELEELSKQAKSLTEYRLDPGQKLDSLIDPNYRPDNAYRPPAEDGDGADGDASEGEAAADQAYAAEGAVAPPHSLGSQAPAAEVQVDASDAQDERPERPSHRASA
jgi:sec-independent protein translocase protein TatB